MQSKDAILSVWPLAVGCRARGVNLLRVGLPFAARPEFRCRAASPNSLRRSTMRRSKFASRCSKIWKRSAKRRCLSRSPN